MLFFIPYIMLSFHVIFLSNVSIAAQESQEQSLTEEQQKIINKVSSCERRSYRRTFDELKKLERRVNDNFSGPELPLLRTRVLRTKIDLALSVLSNKPKNISDKSHIQLCIESVQLLSDMTDVECVKQYLAEQLLNSELPSLNALQNNDLFVTATFADQQDLEEYNSAFRPHIVNELVGAEKLLGQFKNDRHVPSQEEHDQYYAIITRYTQLDFIKRRELQQLLKEVDVKRTQLNTDRKLFLNFIQTTFIDPTEQELFTHFLDIGPTRQTNLVETTASTLQRLYPEDNADKEKIKPLLLQARDKFNNVMKEIVEQ